MTDYTLTHGSHATREDGMCLMEAVAFLAGETHSDRPECACPVLSAYAIAINDAMGTGPDGDALRARYLHDLAPMLVGSRAPEVEQARAFVLADHAVRVFAPLALDAAGLGDEAARLRALGAVVDEHSAWSASLAASGAAMAASGAARDASLDASGAASRAAMAASGAARDASLDAARAASGAARDASLDAARAALIAALEAAP